MGEKALRKQPSLRGPRTPNPEVPNEAEPPPQWPADTRNPTFRGLFLLPTAQRAWAAPECIRTLRNGSVITRKFLSLWLQRNADHVIAITAHNNYPTHYTSPAILAVFEGDKWCHHWHRQEPLSHRRETPSLWRRTIAGKVLGRTTLCVPGCNWIACGGRGGNFPFIISQLIIPYSMLMNHQRLFKGEAKAEMFHCLCPPSFPSPFLPVSHQGLLCHPEEKASPELVIRAC